MRKLLLGILVVLVWGCNKENSDRKEDNLLNPNNEYEISLGFVGEILEITESPLGRSASTDLYGVNVYSSTDGINYENYAAGLFDDPTNITIRLLGKTKYKFEALMIVDGKNRTPSYEMSIPWGMELTNSFVYGEDNMSYLKNGRTFIKLKNGEMEICNIPNVDKYYNELNGYEPTSEGTVSIDMKRVSFGAKFIAEGLTEGRLLILIQNAPEMEIVHGESTEVEDIFSFEYPRNACKSDDYSETIPVNIRWEKADGSVIPIASQEVTFKRKKLITVTVKVSDEVNNNGVNLELEKGEIEQGDNVVIK